jgi:hypothetical protein
VPQEVFLSLEELGADMAPANLDLGQLRLVFAHLVSFNPKGHESEGDASLTARDNEVLPFTLRTEDSYRRDSSLTLIATNPTAEK